MPVVLHLVPDVAFRLLHRRATHFLDQLPPVLAADFRELFLLVSIEQRRDFGCAQGDDYLGGLSGL